jgi:ADP-heptose:LPS heptosyltransferase
MIRLKPGAGLQMDGEIADVCEDIHASACSPSHAYIHHIRCMNLICIADRNWSEGFTGTQQLLTRLAKRGHRILYFEPDGNLGLRDVGPGTLYVHTQRTENVIQSLQFRDSIVLTDGAALPELPSLQGRPVVYYGPAHPGNQVLQSTDVAITESPALLQQFQQVQPRSYLLEPSSDNGIPQANSWDQLAYRLEAHLEEAYAAAMERGLGSTSQLRAIEASQVDSVWPDRTERLEEYGRTLREPVTGLLRAIIQVTDAAGSIYYALRLTARKLAGRRHPEVRKILIGRLAAMGDIIVLSPMLAALRERYPEARIVMAVQKGMPAGPLLESSKNIDEIRVLDFLNSPSRVEQVKGVFKLFVEGFDVAFSGATYFLIREVFVSGAPKRFGIYNGLEIQKYNKTVLPADLSVHEAELNLHLVELLTGKPEQRLRPPRLALDPDKVRQRTAELLAKLAIPPSARILTVHPGSKNPTRRWPTERFAELSTRLLLEDPELRIVLTGSPGERFLVEEIQARIAADLQNRVIDTTGITDLHSLSGLLKASTAALSNDTGVMHLARTVGTPLVAVLGPENDRRWSPHPVGDAPAVAVRNVVPCAPCMRSSCEALYCLRSVSVDRVHAEVARLLFANGAKGSSRLERNRLERKMTHADWRQLAADGFSLPKMTAVLIAEAPVKALSEQSFPQFDTFVLQVDPSRGVEAFESILKGAKGDMLSLFTSDPPWQPEHLAAHAAALTRHPDAAYAYTPERNGNGDHRGGRPLGAYTLRRSELERVLPDLQSGTPLLSFTEIVHGVIERHRGIAADVPQLRVTR